MQTKLEDSIEALRREVGTFNFILHYFLKSLQKTSEVFATKFIECKKKKSKHKDTNELYQTILTEQELYERIAFEDSLRLRFRSTYCSAVDFLKRYLEAKHNYIISSSSPEDVFLACLEKEIITESEAKNLITLSKDLDLFRQSGETLAKPGALNAEPELPIDVVRYGIVMNDILERLN